MKLILHVEREKRKKIYNVTLTRRRAGRQNEKHQENDTYTPTATDKKTTACRWMVAKQQTRD